MRRRNVNILPTPIPVNKVDHVPENISQSSARTQAPTAYHQTTNPSLIYPQTKAHSPQSPLEPDSHITDKEATNAFKQALEPEFSL